MDAWQLRNDEYVRWPEEGGVLHSAAFPGLWLNVRALILEDSAALLGTLNEGLASVEHEEFVRRLEAMAVSQPPAAN